MNYHMTNKQAQQRFHKLAQLIQTNAYQWPTGKRLNDWVYEYNRMIEQYPEAFETYCAENDFSTYHNGYDALA